MAVTGISADCPGSSSLLKGGIALLGVNVFAIYVHYVTNKTIAFFGGPILLMGSAAAYYWLLNVSAGRADLYMFRADALFVGLYLLVGLACVVDRAQRPG